MHIGASKAISMSKMNNNSRKNSKNSKNTAEKALRSKISSKKNFKIENLEPRLMMDASVGTGMIRRQSPVLRHGLTPHPYGLIATR